MMRPRMNGQLVVVVEKTANTHTKDIRQNRENVVAREQELPRSALHNNGKV